MSIYGSKIRTSIIGMVLCLVLSAAKAQDDPSQRPLPLPDRGVTDLPQHMELLKRLRSLVESQQKNAEQPAGKADTLPRLPELPSSADSDIQPQKPDQITPEASPLQPQHLQQFQEALRNLASKLPPGFVPPDLSSVPPDQLRKAMENPAMQQQMKQMLEQFAKDGVLPKPGADGSELPVPPQNDDRQNDGARPSLGKNETRENKRNESALPSPQSEQDTPSEDTQGNAEQRDGSPKAKSPEPVTKDSMDAAESPTDESATGDSHLPDGRKEAPAGSMRSLRSFLKKLAEDAGLNSPEPAADSARSSNSAQSNSSQNEPLSGATDEQPNRSDLKNSSGNNSVPSTRRPLRKRDSAKPKTSPPLDSSNGPALDSGERPSGQFPETSPRPLNRPNSSPAGNIPENSPSSDSAEPNAEVPDVPSSRLPQGLRIDPESARKQLEELQKTIERMKQGAEEPGPGRSSAEEQAVPNEQLERSDSSNNSRGFDSNSVTPSTGRNNRMSSRPDSDNLNGDQLPESLPNVDEFLREQLKNFKLPEDAVPGNKSRNDQASRSSSPGMNPPENSRGAEASQRGVDWRIPIDSSPRDLSMERPISPDDVQRLRDSLRAGKTPDANPLSQEPPKAEKPPIDIAKELEQRGFGNTLKQLVERAKEEAKKPRPPAQDSSGAQEIANKADTAGADIANAVKDASEAAKKADPELSESMAKMLDGLKDDLVEIAKDARFNESPAESRRERSSMNRPSPAESNSMIDTLRKSASEILAGPSRSANSGNSAASGAASATSNAFTGEFDFTPVLVLAGILAALAIAFFGLRHFKFGGNDAAELQFAGPPLKPSDIHSRADVVRAFHEFALRSARSVQSWWTHRTVQQAILEKAPEYRAAVEALANTYEQARYLPVEQELSPEQLESARSALQQCSSHIAKG